MLAENALTTLDRVKLMLGIFVETTDTPTDTPNPETDRANQEETRTNMILELLINKASASIERQIGRRLKKQSYLHRYNAVGQQELVVSEYPVVSVEYIKENGSLVDPARYDFSQTGHLGIIYRDEGWLRAGYRCGLTLDTVTPKRVIEISYTAGYVLPKDATEDEPQTLPADLEGLVWEMVSQAYTNMMNGSQGLKAFSISDVSWTFDRSVNSEWTKLINLYRRYL